MLDFHKFSEIPSIYMIENIINLHQERKMRLYALDNKICKINGNSFSHYGYFPILPFVSLICFIIAFRGFFLGLQFNILSNSSSKLMESVKALI